MRNIRITIHKKTFFSFYCFSWAVSTVMTRQNAIPLEPNNNSKQSQIITKDTDSKSNELELKQDPATIAPNEHENAINTPALIPFWDLSNHMNGIVTTSYNIADAKVEGATLSDIKKGEQIFIHYGNRNNANLLVHNG